MCRLSEKLQLCSCKGSTQHLPNYWKLSRYAESASWYCMGQPMLPMGISIEDNTFNQNLLFELLNNNSAFDIDLNPMDKDHLLLSFTVTDKQVPLEYRFEYMNGTWHVVEDLDIATWNMKHNTELEGVIKNHLES